MARSAYADIIAEDIAWCEEQPRTLERDHVIAVLRHAVAAEYPRPLTDDDAKTWADDIIDGCDAEDLPRLIAYALQKAVQDGVQFTDAEMMRGPQKHAQRAREKDGVKP